MLGYVFVIFICLLVYLVIINYFSNLETLRNFYDKNSDIIKVNNKTFIQPIKKNNVKNQNRYANTIIYDCFDANTINEFIKYSANSKRLVYKKNNEILGEVWITPTTDIDILPQVSLNGLFINNLCVKKKYRQKGIAKQLLNRIIDLARKEGQLHLFLQVNPNKLSGKLHRFYEDLGFVDHLKGPKETTMLKIL